MRTRYYPPTQRRLRGAPVEQKHIGRLYNLIIFGIVIIILVHMAGGIPQIP